MGPMGPPVHVAKDNGLGGVLVAGKLQAAFDTHSCGLLGSALCGAKHLGGITSTASYCNDVDFKPVR